MLITTEIGKMMILDLKGKVLETIQTPEVSITYASFLDEDWLLFYSHENAHVEVF
ncbi:MAG: hypothetical protein AAGC85_20500 [Bacteroidota bacterium]